MISQEALDKHLKDQREKSFKNSPQLSLGELIEKIQSCGVLKENNEPKYVDYDFGTAIPTTLDSWRGVYRELALGYELTGYDSEKNHHGQKLATDLLEHLKSAIGKTYDGWKGGEYEMDEDTPVWVANSGNVGNTAIVDVLDDGYRLVIMTCYCES